MRPRKVFGGAGPPAPDDDPLWLGRGSIDLRPFRVAPAEQVVAHDGRRTFCDHDRTVVGDSAAAAGHPLQYLFVKLQKEFWRQVDDPVDMDVMRISRREGLVNNILPAVFKCICTRSFVPKTGGQSPGPFGEVVLPDLGKELHGFARVAPGTGEVYRDVRI